jgi:hypothetical protein
VWEIDEAGDEVFARPGDLVVADDGTVFLHDYQLNATLNRKKTKISLQEKKDYFTGPSRIPKDVIEKMIKGLPMELTHFFNIQINNGLIYVIAGGKRTGKLFR